MGLREIIATLLPAIGAELKEPVMACSAIDNPFLVHSLIALVGSMFFAIAIYLLSRILGDERQKAFGIGELQEAITTVAILLLSAALIAIPCTPYTDPFTGMDLNAYQRSYYFLQSVHFTLNTLIVYLHVPYFIVSLLDFSTTVFGVPVTSFQGIYGLIKPIFTQNVTLLSMASGIMALLTYTYDLLTAGMLYYILPIGLFLRSFYVTRKVGGAIIGMALALGVIYPFIMSFFYPLEHFFRPPGIEVHGNSIEVDVDTLASSIASPSDPDTRDVYYIDSYLKNLKEEHSNMAKDMVGFISTNAIMGAFAADVLAGLAQKLGDGGISLFKIPLAGIAITTGVGSGFVLALYTLAYGFVFAFLFPIIVTLVVGTAGRFISSALGQEVDLSNLTRLV